MLPLGTAYSHDSMLMAPGRPCWCRTVAPAGAGLGQPQRHQRCCRGEDDPCTNGRVLHVSALQCPSRPCRRREMSRGALFCRMFSSLFSSANPTSRQGSASSTRSTGTGARCPALMVVGAAHWGASRGRPSPAGPTPVRAMSTQGRRGAAGSGKSEKACSSPIEKPTTGRTRPGPRPSRPTSAWRSADNQGAARWTTRKEGTCGGGGVGAFKDALALGLGPARAVLGLPGAVLPGERAAMRC